jgi:predicted RNase H-like nuclease (RuvC/YqgF family)|tara:strand:+ start:128 stop:265 length:138 start_codon:yes stop_codon:yes gene_type:complete
MSKVKRCEQCERLAEENSNLEILIRQLKAQIRKLKEDAKEMYKYP